MLSVSLCFTHISHNYHQKHHSFESSACQHWIAFSKFYFHFDIALYIDLFSISRRPPYDERQTLLFHFRAKWRVVKSEINKTRYNSQTRIISREVGELSRTINKLFSGLEITFYLLLYPFYVRRTIFYVVLWRISYFVSPPRSDLRWAKCHCYSCMIYCLLLSVLDL